MKGIIKEVFHKYPDESIENIVKSSVGSPVTDGSGGPVIGKIIGARRIGNSELVEFEVEFNTNIEIGGF